MIGISNRGCLLLVLWFVLVPGIGGCAKAQESWVIQTDTESVKPRQGVVDKVLGLQGCRGLDWKDENHLIVYRYSATVFGDDRGAATVNVDGTAQSFAPLELQSTVSDFRVSPDGTWMVYTLDSTGQRQGQLVVRQTQTGMEQMYETRYASLRDGLVWNPDGSAYLTDVGEDSTAWRIDGKGAVAEKFVAPGMDKIAALGSEQYGVPLLTSVQRTKKTSYALFKGPEWNKIACYDESGSGTWLPYENVERMALAPSGEQLAILEFSKDYSVKTLIFTDLTGRRISTPVQNQNLLDFAWSKDSTQLVYSIQNKENDIEIYVADLKTGTSSFVAAYPGNGPERLSFSPAGKKLMVVLGTDPAGQSGKPITHILTLK